MFFIGEAFVVLLVLLGIGAAAMILLDSSKDDD